MLPHGTGMVHDGESTEDDVAYYEARARGGVGLVITGGTIVHPTAIKRGHKTIEAFEQHVLPSLKRRSDAIHAHGAKLIGQLFHYGRETLGGEMEYAAMGPSSLRSPRDPSPPHALETDEIAALIAGFGLSAANLRSAGHDGVEIHAAHGYLVAQFLSPATNHRTDAYGGTPERRLRFLREIIGSIRARCGDDFVLGIRLSADEEIAGGLTVPDAARIAVGLAALNTIDYLNITMGIRGAYVKDVSWPVAPAAPAAKVIRQACGLPIILGQKITTPEVAERVLADGAADFVGMARALIADADWAAKAARGESGRIRPCIGVLQDCRSHAPHLHCAVNPLTGRENRSDFKDHRPTQLPQRIAVVGGGPGGMEAARTVAQRGHHVTLFEATGRLGGQFLYASSLPHRTGLGDFIAYLKGELSRLPVGVELNVPINTPSDLKGSFDTVIVATGATALPLNDDVKREGVMSCFDVIAAGAPAAKAGGRAVLLDDGSAFWPTYGAAEILVAAGWQLLIACPGAAVAGAIPHESIGPLLKRLGKGPTEFRVLTTLDKAVPGAAHLRNPFSGEIEVAPCDLIVVQTGRTAVTAPGQALRIAGLNVHMIGDCITPRRMSHAVYEAQRLARVI